jgi:hypothetical protein
MLGLLAQNPQIRGKPQLYRLDMKQKLNPAEVSRYAKQFAKTVCDSFFAQHRSIGGKQMVEVSPSRQVNLFAVKKVFFQWQEETKKLKSPFFDYTAPEVAQALTSFMNTLSRNISIERAVFEPLLAASVQDTILLALSPVDFFAQEWGNLGDAVEVATQLKPVGKYFAIHRPVYEHIVRSAEGLGGYLRRDTLLGAVKAASAVPPDDVAPLFQGLTQVLPARPEQFWLAEDDDPLNFSAGMAELENKPFSISKLSFDIDQEPAKEAPTAKQEPAVLPKPEPQVEPKVEPEPPTISPKVVPLNERFSKREESDSLNNRYTQDQLPSSLNERFGNQQQPVNTVSDLYRSSSKVESLKMVIPLNKKFAFINELFNGNSQEFNEAIDLIDRSTDYPSAIQLVKERYFRKNNWDIEKDEVKEFYELLSRKF